MTVGLHEAALDLRLRLRGLRAKYPQRTDLASLSVAVGLPRSSGASKSPFN